MKYGISMPITGYIYKEVDAGSKEEALEAFYLSEPGHNDIEEWEMVTSVCEGNVTHALINDLGIEEI